MRSTFPDAALIDYARKPLPAAGVLNIVQLAGSVAVVMNARHALVAAHGWKENPPSAEAFALAAAETPNLLRRPIAVSEGRVAVGTAAIRALLA